MRPVLQHAARSLSDYAVLTFSASRPSAAASIPVKSSVCIQCQFRVFSSVRPTSHKRPVPSSVSTAIRHWSSTLRPLQEKPTSDPRTPAIEHVATRASDSAAPGPPSPSKPPPTQPEPVTPVPDEKLPSHRQGLRWDIYKKISAWMDELLPKLILVGQKVNSYTGTDYTGIEALRQEIQQQERLVKARRAQVEDAKRQLEVAQAQQSSSQKEVVGLLERKHSWAANDLERYMSLIRSEHLNDQAVRSAKDAVLSAERALEEARAHLEKRERAQYHEEQIWSDTIRRNSTWVTFGLMGVNILLLLSQLVVLEPWRRRRLVREIKSALDERTFTDSTALAAVGASPVVDPTHLPNTPIPAHVAEVPVELAESGKVASPAIEKEIDDIVEPAGVSLESVEEPTPAPVQDATTDVSPDLSGPEPTISFPENSSAPSLSWERPAANTPREKLAVFVVECNRYFCDLFSERAVSVRKVDITTAALQGAVVGATCVGVVVLALLRIKMAGNDP